jgi:hypothetical protein
MEISINLLKIPKQYAKIVGNTAQTVYFGNKGEKI